MQLRCCDVTSCDICRHCWILFTLEGKWPSGGGEWGSLWIPQMKCGGCLWTVNQWLVECRSSGQLVSPACLVSLWSVVALCCLPALAAQAHSGQDIQPRSQKSAAPKQLWIPWEYFVVMTVTPHPAPLQNMPNMTRRWSDKQLSYGWCEWSCLLPGPGDTAAHSVKILAKGLL